MRTELPDRCVVIEDSPIGLAAARAAGMDCLAYAGGLIPTERLHGLRTWLFDDMTLLMDCLEEVEDRDDRASGRDIEDPRR